MGSYSSKKSQNTTGNLTNTQATKNKPNIEQYDIQINTQQQKQSGNLFQSNDFYNQSTKIQGKGIRLINTKDTQFQKNKTVAIVVTFQTGSSYDNLFTSIQQKSEQGTKTLVYAADSHFIQEIMKGFQKKSNDQTVKELIQEINKIDADCTVFNWQCCSGYTSKTFPQGSQKLMKFLGLVIQRGHMAMFSDFSLKALISNWDPQILGPNPYLFQNEFQGNILVEFQPKTLKQCPSAQLQSVGELSQGGKCNVHTLGSTIVYSINYKNTDNKAYKFQILTVVTNIKAKKNQNNCKINKLTGVAGHTLITYPSNGKLLTSMGHWIELMKIDTSQQKIFEVAMNNYGSSQVQNVRKEMDRFETKEQKRTYLNSKARQYVQESAPCSNQAQKMKKTMF